ncbi:MAG: GTPase [archaeon]|jgi:hypothetical protein
MPANASYEFGVAQRKYDEAKTDEEKVIALQGMLSTAPTHKGSENLRRDISKRIADLKNKMEKRAAALKKTGHSISIKKEGAGQVVIVGLANSGKSTFLTKFTNAKPTIAPYAYTTTKPEVGVLNYGGALIQIVELPSFLESKEMANQILSMIRCSDAIILTITDYSKEQMDRLITLLEAQDIYITKQKPKIELTKSQYLGITFINEQNLTVPKEQAIALLRDSGYRSHTVILGQKTNMEDLLLLMNPRAVYLPCFCVSMPFTKNLSEIGNYKNIKVYPFSEEIKITEEIFKMVNKIIIYTKKPGQKVDLTDPLVLEKGATVKEAAKQIHKTISKELRSAKVWGSTRFPGQNVSKNYILKDKDVVEFVV